MHQGFEYSRTHNPTRFAYERCVATLEGGSRGDAFASGMAATSTVLELLDSGDHVIAMDDIYGGTYRLFERVRRRSAGLDFSFVDLTDTAAFQAAIRPQTKMVWIETPTNPMLKIVDIEAVSAIARKHGLRVVVDNTFASPILQRPLQLGADLVMHSATKYLNGHSDMVGGMVVVGDDTELAEQMAFLQNSIGALQGPFDSFLALRGLKTLHLRMKAHCENAQALAEFLEAHPAVEKVIYPGLKSHPQHELAKRQMDGSGAVSYTHLDVYKRQGYRCVRAVPEAGKCQPGWFHQGSHRPVDDRGRGKAWRPEARRDLGGRYRRQYRHRPGPGGPAERLQAAAGGAGQDEPGEDLQPQDVYKRQLQRNLGMEESR